MTALDWTHATRDIPAEGLKVQRQATPAELAALAQEIEIPKVDAVTVAYRIKSAAGGRFTLEGRLDAQVTQECVVTLEPVAGVIAVDLDVVFRDDLAADGDEEIEGSADDLDGPDEEPIENGVLDIGRIVSEELVSGLDPYPRKADAAFDWKDEKISPEANPFAALAKLKDPKQPQ